MAFTRSHPRNQDRTSRGYGTLDLAAQEHALLMLRAGRSQAEVARHLNVTKNIVAGIWARHGDPQIPGPDPSTLFGRLGALHANMDIVLAENLGVGRVPDVPRVRVARR